MEMGLLGAEDGVLGSLGYPELHHALGRDLDRFARSRVPVVRNYISKRGWS